MSTETHVTTGHAAHDAHHGEPVRAEPDFVPAGVVIAGVAFIVVIFLVGIFWSYRILRHTEAAVDGIAEDGAPRPNNSYQYEVGIVNQEQFAREKRAYQMQGAQKDAVNNYGWQDREKKLVHVPVEQGAQKLMTEQGGQK